MGMDAGVTALMLVPPLPGVLPREDGRGAGVPNHDDDEEEEELVGVWVDDPAPPPPTPPPTGERGLPLTLTLVPVGDEERTLSSSAELSWIVGRDGERICGWPGGGGGVGCEDAEAAASASGIFAATAARTSEGSKRPLRNSSTAECV
jgi:hypothetical protein